MKENIEAKRRALNDIQSFIEKGASLAKTTTAVSDGKIRELAKWNDEVLRWFNQLYRSNDGVRKEFEDELKRFVATRDRFTALLERLVEWRQKIESGNWRFLKFGSVQEMCGYL